MVFAKTALIKEHPVCHYHHLTLLERVKIMFFAHRAKISQPLPNSKDFP